MHRYISIDAEVSCMAVTVENTIESVFAKGFDIYKKQYVAFILATVVAILGSVFIITSIPLFFGLYVMAIKAIKGETVKVSDVFKGFDYFFISWLMFIFAGVAIMFGFMLFVIPGIFLLFMFQYVAPIAILERIGPVSALKRSYSLARANLQFSIALGILLWIINAIGGALGPLGLITIPFTFICFSIAVSNLLKSENVKVKPEDK